MNSRRKFIQGMLAGGTAGAGVLSALARGYDQPAPAREKGVKRILHLTDMHLRPELECPRRAAALVRQALREAGQVDLVFNGGDTIYAADYGNITRERVLEQWKVWDEAVVPLLKGIPMIHALGNHDMWWAGKKDDAMYGKAYVLKRLGQKKAYFGMDFAGWRLLVLDCNHRGLLDAAQEKWLMEEARAHADKPLAILSHQPLMMGGYLLGRAMNKREHQLVDPFVSKDIEARPVHFISGHEHVLDHLQFKNVQFHCNGALSGFWWEFDPDKSPDCSYEGTPMGYAVIDLHTDGTLRSYYRNVTDAQGGKLLDRP